MSWEFSKPVSGGGSITAADVIAALASAATSIDINGQKIVNAGTPTADTDLATKGYVDAVAVGLMDPKASVRAATTANITLSGAQTIDGVSVIAGDRVLVKNQSTDSQNGIYVCAAGAWARATDADSSAEVTAGLYVFVEEGSSNADTGWVLTTNNPITLGSTALTFVKFTSLGGDVVGPSSSTDNGLPRFDGTGGKTLQTSGVVISDADTLELPHTSTGGLTLWNTSDHNTNSEYGTFAWAANILTLRTWQQGTGTARAIQLFAGPASVLSLSTIGATYTGNISTNSADLFALNNFSSWSSTALMQNAMSIKGTVNQTSGSGGWTGLLINPTLTAVGSAGAYLLRAQTAGTDRFTVSSAGSVSCAGVVAGGDVTTSGLLHAYRNTAPPAGGAAGTGLRLSSTANLGVFFGSGAPTLSAAKGSLYLRTDGSTTNDRMYVNTDGATAWTAVTTAS